MNIDKNRKYILIITLSALFLFIPFLGSVHLFDWDEINFAESAREMLVTGNYTHVQINYEPFWEKPPLFFWFQAASMKIFGVNEFAARLPNALTGLITLLTFYFIGRRLYNERFGFLWALCYLGSFLPHLYFHSAIIDPLFNYFIFLSIFWFASSVKEPEKIRSARFAFYSGLFIGLAILTKGPVGLLIFCLTVLIYWSFLKFRRITTVRNILIFGFTAFAVSFLWFGIETLRNGTWFLKEFIIYQIRLFTTPDAGHGQPFYYHFLVVAIGCFPISVLAIMGFVKKETETEYNFTRLMKILFWVVMILFSIVTTKIVHYSSLAYFPLSFLAAVYLKQITENNLRVNKFILIALIFVGTIFSLLITALPLLFMYKEHIYVYLKDPFAVACLQTPVTWGGYEFLIGIIYLASVIFALLQIYSRNLLKGLYVLFFSTAICISVFLAVVAPKIEEYSQKPAIEYFQKHAGEDVYMVPFGYKSYAHYFYFQTPPNQNPLSAEIQWLLNGKTDKPVYFVAKVTKAEELKKYTDIKFIGQKGGYALYFRPRQ
jgi:4-amino-4-deoxy-L-arabinose transferase-like glycosyltransferase